MSMADAAHLLAHAHLASYLNIDNISLLTSCSSCMFWIFHLTGIFVFACMQMDFTQLAYSPVTEDMLPDDDDANMVGDAPCFICHELDYMAFCFADLSALSQPQVLQIFPNFTVGDGQYWLSRQHFKLDGTSISKNPSFRILRVDNSFDIYLVLVRKPVSWLPDYWERLDEVIETDFPDQNRGMLEVLPLSAQRLLQKRLMVPLFSAANIATLSNAFRLERVTHTAETLERKKSIRLTFGDASKMLGLLQDIIQNVFAHTHVDDALSLWSFYNPVFYTTQFGYKMELKDSASTRTVLSRYTSLIPLELCTSVEFSVASSLFVRRLSETAPSSRYTVLFKKEFFGASWAFSSRHGVSTYDVGGTDMFGNGTTGASGTKSKIVHEVIELAKAAPESIFNVIPVETTKALVYTENVYVVRDENTVHFFDYNTVASALFACPTIRSPHAVLRERALTELKRFDDATLGVDETNTVDPLLSRNVGGRFEITYKVDNLAALGSQAAQKILMLVEACRVVGAGTFRLMSRYSVDMDDPCILAVTSSSFWSLGKELMDLICESFRKLQAQRKTKGSLTDRQLVTVAILEGVGYHFSSGEYKRAEGLIKHVLTTSHQTTLFARHSDGSLILCEDIFDKDTLECTLPEDVFRTAFETHLLRAIIQSTASVNLKGSAEVRTEEIAGWRQHMTILMSNLQKRWADHSVALRTSTRHLLRLFFSDMEEKIRRNDVGKNLINVNMILAQDWQLSSLFRDRLVFSEAIHRLEASVQTWKIVDSSSMTFAQFSTKLLGKTRASPKEFKLPDYCIFHTALDEFRSVLPAYIEWGSVLEAAVYACEMIGYSVSPDPSDTNFQNGLKTWIAISASSSVPVLSVAMGEYDVIRTLFDCRQRSSRRPTPQQIAAAMAGQCVEFVADAKWDAVCRAWSLLSTVLLKAKCAAFVVEECRPHVNLQCLVIISISLNWRKHVPAAVREQLLHMDATEGPDSIVLALALYGVRHMSRLCTLPSKTKNFLYEQSVRYAKETSATHLRTFWMNALMDNSAEGSSSGLCLFSAVGAPGRQLLVPMQLAAWNAAAERLDVRRHA